MKEDNMKSIGEIAKIVELSVSTLRYYDDIALLKPIYTDDKTNYRYYSDEQINQLLRILEFKKYGFSLDAIRGLLHETDNEKIISALKSKVKEMSFDLKDITEVKRLLLNRIENFDAKSNNVNTTFLLVDDSRFLKGIVNEILINNDFVVVGQASDGVEGIEKYKELNPDVVIMDIGMPRLDGLLATKEIIADFPDAKILICSAKSESRSVLTSLRNGAIDFIPKPFSQDHLISSINTALNDNKKKIDMNFIDFILSDKDFENYLNSDNKLSLDKIKQVLNLLSSCNCTKKTDLINLLEN